MACILCCMCSADYSSSWEGCKVITYLVWLRWEDCKAVTTEKLKSYTPLFEGDEIIIDDRLVTILKVKTV